MDESSAFCINAWWLGELLNNSVLVEPWAVIKLAYSTRGEANVGHIGEDTAFEDNNLA